MARIAIFGSDTLAIQLAARSALMGQSLALVDPDGAAGRLLEVCLEQAGQALPALYDVTLPPPGEISVTSDLDGAQQDVDVVISSGTRPTNITSLTQTIFASVRSEEDAVSDEGLTLRAAEPLWLVPAACLVGPANLQPPLAAFLSKVGLTAQSDEDVAQARGLVAATDDDPKSLLIALRALKKANRGLGAALALHEKMLAPAPKPPAAHVQTLSRRVPPDWVDYNGHMNEQFYLTVFSDATDRFLLWAGMDDACVSAGHSVFTVETHIRHLAEIDIGAEIDMTTRVLDGGGKRLHLWHELRCGEQVCATGEQMLLHMDLRMRHVAAPPERMSTYFKTCCDAQKGLPAPEGLGRYVGAPRET